MQRHLIAAVGICCVFSASRVHGQANPSANLVQFDVVSIKPSGMDPRSFGMLGYWKDAYQTQGWALADVILNAYLPTHVATAVPRDGFPSWVNSERYDIVAKVDERTAAEIASATEAERTAMVQSMVQRMLADRFGLVVHRVPVEVEGYALVVAKNGPKLTHSQPGDVVPDDFRDTKTGGKVRFLIERSSVPEIDYLHAPIAELVDYLSRYALIVDHTGLKGTYNFSLLPLQEAPVAGNESAQRDTRLEDPLRWDLRPLGLALKPVRVETETIVIDSIHRPSTN